MKRQPITTINQIVYEKEFWSKSKALYIRVARAKAAKAKSPMVEFPMAKASNNDESTIGDLTTF